MISLTSRIENKYHGSFTLMDAINDPLINKNLPVLYVPSAEKLNPSFLKKDYTVTNTENEPRKVCFIYLNASGKNITNPDSSHIQIPNSAKGFLARLSVSRMAYTAENLELDYLVDISNIKYKLDTQMNSYLNNNNTGSIVMDEVLKFETLEIRDYPKVDFDRQIKEFILNKGQLFATYFR